VEFVDEYSKFSRKEQKCRLSLIDNISREEFEHRLQLLAYKRDEIEALCNQRELPIFDKLVLLGEEEPEFFEEVEEPEEEGQEEEFFPQQDFTPPEEQQMEEDDINEVPAWVRALITNQQTQLEAITRLLEMGAAQQRNGHDSRPIRTEHIYDFEPSDTADDMTYYFFLERINDMVAQYGENKVLPSLVTCLKNERAKTWYASLSKEDKNSLRESTQGWKTILKCDFGIKPFRAKQLAARETFAFAQGCSVLKYFDIKIACLRISEVDDEDMQCHEIKEGLRDPEFCTAMRLSAGDNTTSWMHQELISLESDCKALWQKSQRPVRPVFADRRNNGARQPGSAARSENKFSERGCSTSRGRGRSRGGSQFTPRNKERLAITASASTKPPRPCRFCGADHWDQECTYAATKPKASAYHCYNTDVSEEEFASAEDTYEALQSEVFAVAEDEREMSDDSQDSNESIDQYFDDCDDNESATSATAKFAPPPKAPPSTCESITHAYGHVILVDTTRKYACETCDHDYPTRNKLFAHLREKNHFKRAQTELLSDEVQVIESNAPTETMGTGYAFRDHNFTEIKYRLSKDNPEDYGCLDTGSGMSLIDEGLLSHLP